MMTNEERIMALHVRVATLQRQRERRKTGAVGAASIILTVCLLFVIFGGGGMHPGGAAGLYSGATMLFEGAGPYVLVALLAFVVGVAVTVFCIRRQRKQPKEPSADQEEKKENTP